MLDGDILAYSGEFRELHSLQVCSLPLSPKSREKVLKYKTNYVHTDWYTLLATKTQEISQVGL